MADTSGSGSGGHGSDGHVPHFRPPEQRYAELPESTRAYLAQLRPDDIDLLRRTAEITRSVETVGKFARWLLITIVGVASGLALFGESLGKIWGWFVGDKR